MTQTRAALREARRESLYCFVEQKRRSYGLSAADIPADPFELAAREGGALVIEYRAYERRGLGGALFKGPVSLITLNDRRGPEETRFSLAHELMHYWLDRDGAPVSGAFSEWRANEGAAELLVPRAALLPLARGHAMAMHRGRARDLEHDLPWLTATAALFGVTEAVVRYRVRGMRGTLAPLGL